MKLNTLPTYSLLTKRFWLSTYQPGSAFYFSEEEKSAFCKDLEIYLHNIRTNISDTLDLKRRYVFEDLICHLKNVETSNDSERSRRIIAVTEEVTDEEFHCFAELICTLNLDLSHLLEDLKIYLIIRIWNSHYSFYDPKTELLIEHYLSEDHAFHEVLAENCAHGINNPGFCRWIIANWNMCCYYHEKLSKALSLRQHFNFAEQQEICMRLRARE